MFAFLTELFQRELKRKRQITEQRSDQSADRSDLTWWKNSWEFSSRGVKKETKGITDVRHADPRQILKMHLF